MDWPTTFFFLGGGGLCFSRDLVIHNGRVYVDAMNFKPASTMKLCDTERACMNLRRFGPRH